MKVALIVAAAACLAATVRADGPKLMESFHIVGHWVADGFPSAIYRYNFDVARNRSSIITIPYNVSEPQHETRVIVDGKGHQTLRISDKVCTHSNELPSFVDQLNQHQVDLQALVRTSSKSEGIDGTSRGRPVTIYKDVVEGINVEISWIVTAKGWGDVDYPYEIVFKKSDTDVIRLSVLGFNLIADSSEIEIPYGVQCAGYYGSEMTRLPNLGHDTRKSLSFKAEIPPASDGDSPQWFEGYYSWASGNLVSRIDWVAPNSSDIQTLISSVEHEEAFILHEDVGPQNCTPTALKDANLPLSINLVDLHSIHRVGKGFHFLDIFYGGRAKEMTFKRKDTFRGIPCEVFTLVRKDWPFNKNWTTLWEWCIRIDPSEAQNDYPVFLQIYSIQSDLPGSNINYTFYNTKQEDKNMLEIRQFDLSACFDKNNSMDLVFSLKVEAESSDSDYLFSSEFLLDLRDAIGENSVELEKDYIRIQKTNVLVVEDAVYVKFTLLNKISAKDSGGDLASVKTYFEGQIDNEALVVYHEDIEFVSVPKSLMTREEFLAKFADKPTPPKSRRTRSVFKPESSWSTSSMGVYAAYGFASLVFAVGCGVAIAEWYLRVHRSSSVFKNNVQTI